MLGVDKDTMLALLAPEIAAEVDKDTMLALLAPEIAAEVKRIGFAAAIKKVTRAALVNHLFASAKRITTPDRAN